MITVNVRYSDNYANIEFPCTDEYMLSKLIELHVDDTNNTTLFVDEVTEPEKLSMLKGNFVNLDELNFLAKRMESFDLGERMQFYSVSNYYGIFEMKDLINLTFNLPKYTLIQNMSSMEAVGKTHLINKLGGMLYSEMKETDFAAVGKALIDSVKGKITEYGLIFENEDVQFEEVYDGKVFPEYVYEIKLVTATIEYNGRTEYAYLPDSKLSIDKAVKRLGASSLSDCNVILSDFSIDDSRWFERFKNILKDESLYAVNHLAKAIENFPKSQQYAKLSAVAEYADVNESELLATLAEKLDSFIFIPDICCPEAVGRYWTEYFEEYKLNPELEDFFLFTEFGEQIKHDLSGEFLSKGGFVCIDGEQTLENILGTAEDESMTMGGM